MRSLFDTVPHNNTPTSKSAAASQFAGSKTAIDRARILAHLRERGGMGATNDEIAEHLSIKLATVCARRNELVRDNLAVVTGKTRMNAGGSMCAVVMIAGEP